MQMTTAAVYKCTLCICQARKLCTCCVCWCTLQAKEHIQTAMLTPLQCHNSRGKNLQQGLLKNIQKL